MQFTREINRLVIVLLLAFGLVALSAAYWAIAGPDTILKRQDNPRLVEAEAEIIRGDMLDRNGNVLVTSLQNEDGSVTRRYLYPEMSSALGYYSLRYGVGGAEAAYNLVLRGDNLPRDLTYYLTHNLLHHPQEGSAIRLTFDLAIQQQLVEAMQGQAGAAVVLAVPSGEILALASLPTFDPNHLDASWETLTKDLGKPFFNRAIQGRYQPGSALQTPLIAAALLTAYPMDKQVENATHPVLIANTQLACAVRLPDRALTLREAYAFACPAPFRELAQDLGLGAVEAAFDTFHLNQPPILPDYESTAAAPAAATIPFRLQPDTLVAQALGQGQLTITPLEMAVMVAAIVNDGNAPQPYTLIETRAPASSVWNPAATSFPSTPFVTANTARQLQDMMRLAVTEGAAQNAGRPNIDIGGHSSLAYSGPESQAWFVGFATLGGRQGVAIALVLENSSDPGLAADIGGSVLALAQQQMQKGN